MVSVVLLTITHKQEPDLVASNTGWWDDGGDVDLPQQIV